MSEAVRVPLEGEQASTDAIASTHGPPAWDGPPPASGSIPGRLVDRAKAVRDRMSIRWRLTLTYSALFFTAGASLLLAMYVIIRSVLREGLSVALQVPVNTPQSLIEFWKQQIHLQQRVATDVVLGGLVKQSLTALLGMGIFALIVGYFVADRALRPVQQMTATARKLSDSTLAHERIALRGPDDELKELADTFDAMLTRLNLAFGTQRRFVANASHELRTPLTINRTVLEIALSDPEASDDLKALGRTLLEVNARNERLIEGLLLLARSERELTVRKPMDVKDVVMTALEPLRPTAAEAGVTLTTELRSAVTTGDPVLLERSVANLVENALKYNVPENGRVWVRTDSAGGSLTVQVANTGPHVPAYEVGGLFEPFRRLSGDRVDSVRGAGLGLSIVRAVMNAHGGDVTAIPRDGGGLVVTLRLTTS